MMFNKNKDLTKTWLTLYLLVFIIFSIVGLAMIIFDNLFFNGIRYLLTAIIFGTSALFIKQKRVQPDFSDPLIFLGFIFSIIGLTSTVTETANIGMWSLGIVFFLSGMFKK